MSYTTLVEIYGEAWDSRLLLPMISCVSKSVLKGQKNATHTKGVREAECLDLLAHLKDPRESVFIKCMEGRCTPSKSRIMTVSIWHPKKRIGLNRSSAIFLDYFTPA